MIALFPSSTHIIARSPILGSSSTRLVSSQKKLLGVSGSNMRINLRSSALIDIREHSGGILKSIFFIL
nr:MAG TPA: hypothetical protein [Caudoviricetes sp.]